jgi:hypothetical protein
MEPTFVGCNRNQDLRLKCDLVYNAIVDRPDTLVPSNVRSSGYLGITVYYAVAKVP